MKVTAIIQARMGSERLPGKVLKSILGQPLLWHLLRRVKLSRSLDQVILATSHRRADDAIASLAAQLKIPCFRGSLTNVLDRYYQAARQFFADPIVRLTGDNPLIDPQIIDQAVNCFQQFPLDYVSTTRVHSFPAGISVEVMSLSALTSAWQKATSLYDLEHVTPFLYNPRHHFKIKDIVAPPGLRRPQLRLTVDAVDDLQLVRAIFRALYPRNQQFSLLDIITYLDSHPQLIGMNRHLCSPPAKYHRDV